MAKEVINVPNAPRLPFSPAVRAGDFIFVSGQLGSRDNRGNPVIGIRAQTETALDNLKRVLAAAGASLDDVVKVTVYLRNAEEFATMNAAYEKYFMKDRPARSTVVAALAMADMLIELDAVAYRPAKG